VSLAGERVERRRLTAILMADVAGYSRLVGADEEGTLGQWKAHWSAVIEPNFNEHHGRIARVVGDRILAEFASIVDAVRCAVQVQTAMAERNAEVPQEKRIEFRIGINFGEVIVEGGDFWGDGINIAARLEALAEPGGICVSGRVQEDVEGKLEIGFEDTSEHQLKNIARPVRVYRVRFDGAAKPPPTLPLPSKPSIAVMAFENMTGDPEQEYFADGISEDIITILSRSHSFFVIARNSSFVYKRRAVDVKRIGRELGVRYVLEGSVRKAGSRIRITAQLIEAETSAHLWAERYDRPLDDIFAVQDELTMCVVAAIEPTLEAAEARRSVERPTADLTAYDLYLRARSDRMVWEKEHTLHALDLFRQAIERDPHYALALAQAALCHQILDVNGWTEDKQQNREEGIDLANRALRTSSNDAHVLGPAAYVLGYFEQDITPAIALMDRTLRLNPSFAIGWHWSGWLRLWAGDVEIAIEHFERSLRLNPLRRDAGGLGVAIGHFFARRLDTAAAMLLLSLKEQPNWAPCYRFLASCYAHLGRLEDARKNNARITQNLCRTNGAERLVAGGRQDFEPVGSANARINQCDALSAHREQPRNAGPGRPRAGDNDVHVEMLLRQVQISP
jgi:adenylate cyclase